MSDFFSRGNNISKPRLVALGGIIVAVVVVYLGYLFSMQIVEGYVYSLRADQVKRRSVVIPAQRGEVFDRNYDAPLVTNVDSFAVDIVPADIPPGRYEEVFGRVSNFLDVPLSQIQEKIPPKKYHQYQPVEIRSGVPFDKITYLAEHISDYPGVSWRNKPIRRYTQSGGMAHVIGYVGDITPEELQVLFNQGYSAGAVLGKSGVEYQYDKLLRGKDGRRYRTVDAQGRRVGDADVENIPPEPGKTLVLSVDRHIQSLSKKALGDRIGSVVVLKPSTGEILSMVSYPTFDPNTFYTQNGSQNFRKVSLKDHSPFLNRAIQGAYPPASTFKILMTTAVMEEDAFGLNDTVNCVGYYVLGNRVFHDWRRNGFGPLNIFGGLANSSNVFFWTMGVEHLGVDTIVDYADRFGFGHRTGIDLPGEVPGLVPNPEWKRKMFNTPWVGGDTANMSVGQGYLGVTPLQLANMVALIVNNGVIYKPHVLKEVRDPVTGEVLTRVEPEILRAAPMKQSTFDNVKKAMRGVITDGTAEVVITTPAVKAAGKTGTGQAGYEDQWHSWFVAYAPYDSPNPDDQVVVCVFVDAANEWEWWAPKAANIILQGIFKDENYEDAVADLRKAPKPLWYM